MQSRGRHGFPTQAIQKELRMIYGRACSMVLELMNIRPSIVYPLVIARLKDRAIQLRMKKFRNMSRFAIDLEGTVPAQRSKYQQIPNSRKEIPEFSRIGETPMSFRPDLSYLLQELFDAAIDISYLIQDRPTQEIEISAELVKSIILELRRTGEFRVSFNHASALCSAVMLLSILDIVPEIDSWTEPGIRIPVEFGLTHRLMHGHYRLLRIGVESILRRKWNEGVLEMSGMFLCIDLEKAAMILRVMDLFVKCMGAWAMNQSEPDLLVCTLGEEGLGIRSLEKGWNSTYLDLSKMGQW
jgi:hypothetical protein